MVDCFINVIFKIVGKNNQNLHYHLKPEIKTQIHRAGFVPIHFRAKHA